MVRATLTITVKPGKEEEFERVWREIADRVRAEPGNVRQTLARDPDDPATFIVTSDWGSGEAFHRFETSEDQDELTAPIRELRSSARMTVHDVLADIEGGG